MNIKRALAALLLAGLSPAGAQAEARYPSKPITIVYPYAPGSASDTLSRVVGEVLQKALGQPVIVENKPGAGGTIALEYVSRAQPTATRWPSPPAARWR